VKHLHHTIRAFFGVPAPALQPLAAKT
jgi:hypothetical protein